MSGKYYIYLLSPDTGETLLAVRTNRAAAQEFGRAEYELLQCPIEVRTAEGIVIAAFGEPS